MAEKRVIELEVKENFKKVENDLDSLNQALKETATANRDVNKTFEEVYGDLQPLTTRLGEAEDRLYELAAAGDTTSKEYQSLLSTVANYRKVQISTDMVVDAASTTMSTKMVNAIGGVANAFSVAEGAAALMGFESEDLQKTMVKLQAAMSIAQGAQGIIEAKNSFNQLGESVSNAFKGMTAAGKAFAVTGIGLLITGIGLLISNWDKVSEYIGITSNEQEKFNNQQKQLIQDAKEMRETVSKESAVFVGYISQLKATNKGSKERSQLISEINKKYGTTLKNLSDEAEFQAQLNKEVKNYLEYQKAKFTLQKNEEKITKNLEAQDEIATKINKQKKRQIEIEKELESSRKSLSSASRMTTETQLYSQYDKIQQKINSLNEEYKQGKSSINEYSESLKHAEKRLDYYGASSLKAQGEIDKLTYNGKKYVEQNNEVTTSNEEVTKSIEEWELTEQDFYDKINTLKKENYLNTLSDKEKELALVDDKYLELEIKAKENSDALAAIELAKMNDINDINLKYQDIEYENDKKAKEKKAELDKEASQKEIENAKTVAEAKKQIQQQGLDVALQGVQLIASIFEKQKGIQKAAVIAESAIGIAKIITSTQAANAGAIAKYSLIPGGQALAATEITLNRISAGIGIASNIAATAKALQALGGGSAPNSSNDSGMSNGGGTITAPSFNVIGSSGVNQLAQIQQQPTRAYVVSGDIANGLSLERNRLQNASF